MRYFVTLTAAAYTFFFRHDFTSFLVCSKEVSSQLWFIARRTGIDRTLGDISIVMRRFVQIADAADYRPSSNKISSDLQNSSTETEWELVQCFGDYFPIKHNTHRKRRKLGDTLSCWLSSLWTDQDDDRFHFRTWVEQLFDENFAHEAARSSNEDRLVFVEFPNFGYCHCLFLWSQAEN